VQLRKKGKLDREPSDIMTKAYGLHLAAQLSSIANARALDEIEVAEFLKNLVAAIGMRVLAGPLCGRNYTSLKERNK
jgi:hypothetical protein